MNELKHTLQTEIQEALSSGISQNKLSEQIGVSAATLINVRRGEWELVSDSMLMKLRGYFRINDWKIYETNNMKTITSLCADAAENRKCTAIAGYTGAGKSTSLRKYASKHADAWYVLGTTIMTQTAFLSAILRAMGVADGRGIQDKMNIISRQMNAGKNSLLIIDDAGKLNDNILRLIQILYDETEDNAGIILSGTEYLEKYMTRGVVADKRGFRELYRRISYWQPMLLPTKSEITYICRDYGITDANVVMYIYKSQSDWGSIRNLITNALQLSAKTGTPIDRELLEDLKIGNHHYKTA